MADFESLLRSRNERASKSKIDSWLKANPDRDAAFRDCMEAFVAVRQDGGTNACSFEALTDVVKGEFGLEVCVKAVQRWVKRLHPDEPALRD